MSRHFYRTVFWLLLTPLFAVHSWATTFQVPSKVTEQSQSFDQYTEWLESLTVYVPRKEDSSGPITLQDLSVSGLLHYQVFDHAQEASIPYLNQLITAELSAVGYSLIYQCENDICGERTFWQKNFAPLSTDGSEQQSYLVFVPQQTQTTRDLADIVQVYLNTIGCCARSTWRVVSTDFPVFDSPVFDSPVFDSPVFDSPVNDPVSIDLVPITTVLFDTDSAVISIEGHSDIATLSHTLKNSNARYWIDGHTDDIGSDAANMLLSRQRAEAVLATLLSLGATPDQFTVRAFGSTSPRATNHTELGRQSNRRVEMIKQP